MMPVPSGWEFCIRTIDIHQTSPGRPPGVKNSDASAPIATPVKGARCVET